MPIEDIQTPKAPRGWTPSADQQRVIQSDPRLRGMSRDQQYFYFNKPPVRGQGQAPRAGGTPHKPAEPQGFFEAIFAPVLEALRGGR